MINIYPKFTEMQTVEVFVYHDRPLLFSAQDILGQKYLSVLTDEEDMFEDWIYVAVSQSRLEMIRSGGIDLHDAFGKPENDIIFKVRNKFDGDVETTVVFANELPVELLPKKNTKLNLSTPTLPTLSEKANRAISTLREAISLKLNFHQINRTEAPAHTLGNILVSFQDSLNSLIHGEAWLRVVGFKPGSFNVLLDAEAQSDLFDNSNVADALKLLENFIESSRNEETFDQNLLLLDTRAKKNLKKFLENISGDVISTEIEWKSPKQTTGKVFISNEKALSIYEKIEKLSEPQIKVFEIKGTLEGIDIRTKHFRIVTLEDHENYSGYMKDESVAENSVVQSAQINQVYLATIEESTNPEEQITKYKLIKLDHI